MRPVGSRLPDGSSGCDTAHCASFESARPAPLRADKVSGGSIGLIVDRSTRNPVYLIDNTPVSSAWLARDIARRAKPHTTIRPSSTSGPTAAAAGP